MPPAMRRVLVVGGSFAGLCVGRDLATHFLVTIVDCKEFFEYTPGILRCFVKPKHFDALSFNLHPVIEEKMGCKFIWGEVLSLNENRTAVIKPMFTDSEEVIDFDYCIITAGCNFGPFKPKGESLWFPTVHEVGRSVSEWPQFDERFIEGRRRHIFHEYAHIDKLKNDNVPVLVVGAGFIGVEWVTELEHFFKGLKISLTDILPAPLGPLPLKAKGYCQKYMTKVGINQFYSHRIDWSGPTLYKIDASNPKAKKENVVEFASVNIEDPKAMKQYICIGVKASNYFMPESTLSAKGPGGGGWILMDKTLAVKDRDNKVWCVDDKNFPRIFAVGDCNYGCITPISDNEQCVQGKNPGPPGEWPIPPIPKISYPGEEEGVIAARNVEKIDHLYYHNRDEDCFGNKHQISGMHWPWGAGMFATSLGPHDACFVVSANWTPNSGFTVIYGSISAVQKEFIEHSKVDECAFGFIGRAIWHFVHHTPLHLWGGGPRWGY